MRYETTAQGNLIILDRFGQNFFPIMTENLKIIINIIVIIKTTKLLNRQNGPIAFYVMLSRRCPKMNLRNRLR